MTMTKTVSRGKRGSPAGEARLRDVARAAGVGLATASRALGEGGRVSPETRRRVRRAARELGYRPVRSARVLRGARARLIGVLVPDLAQPVYGLWLRGAGEAAQARGYVLLVCDGQNSMRVIETLLDRLFEERVDGLLLAGSTPAPKQIRRFRRAAVPIAPDLTRRRSGENLRAAEERPATLEAFRHLVALGHRRILYLARVERDERYLPTLQRLRIDCLRQALAEVGARLPERAVLAVDGPAEALRALARRLESRLPPTAIVAGAEALTPPILEAVRHAGLSVPRDVSVLGTEDSPWERVHEPPIGVVRHDAFALAHALTVRLIDQIEGVERPPPLPPFPAEFLPRGSLAPPPAAKKSVSQRSGSGRPIR